MLNIAGSSQKKQEIDLGAKAAPIKAVQSQHLRREGAVQVSAKEVPVPLKKAPLMQSNSEAHELPRDGEWNCKENSYREALINNMADDIILTAADNIIEAANVGNNTLNALGHRPSDQVEADHHHAATSHAAASSPSVRGDEPATVKEGRPNNGIAGIQKDKSGGNKRHEVDSTLARQQTDHHGKVDAPSKTLHIGTVNTNDEVISTRWGDNYEF